jgi:hypothetical protein
MTELYHLTCRHRAGEIVLAGQVIPHQQPVFGYFSDAKLSWFTHVPTARNVALGLTSHTLKCDRTERRFRVLEPEKVFRWNDIRSVLPQDAVLALESAHGTRPEWWWVAQEPVRVEEVTIKRAPVRR